MQKPITIEVHGALSIVRFHGQATDEQYNGYLQEMTRVIEHNRLRYNRNVVINDATKWMGTSAQQRKLQADWLKQHEEVIRLKTAGIAFVITSALVRGGLTAVFWLSPLPCPHKIFADMHSAMAWAKATLGDDMKLAPGGV